MSKGESTEILLVDDHSLIAELVATYLPREGEFTVSVANNAEEGVAKINSHGSFGVVLLDVQLPERLSLDEISKIVSANEGGSVVLFSGSVSEDFVKKSLTVGTLGFIPKTLSLRSLANSIRLIASGEAFIPAVYFKDSPNSSIDNGFDLNIDEVEVLKKLGQGLSNKEIMQLMDLPESTVKMRVRNLSRKLSARNRTHAVVIAREAGLI